MVARLRCLRLYVNSSAAEKVWLLISTGLGWRFAQHWALSFSLQQVTLEFENGEIDTGDPDWYLHDMDEMTVGVGIAWLF